MGSLRYIFCLFTTSVQKYTSSTAVLNFLCKKKTINSPLICIQYTSQQNNNVFALVAGTCLKILHKLCRSKQNNGRYYKVTPG